MGCRMKRALVALCNSIRAVFRKKRQPSHLKRRTRDRGSTDRTPRCVGDDQNVNTSSSDVSAVGSSQNSPSRLALQRCFEIYQARLPPIEDGKYTSQLLLSEFLKDPPSTTSSPKGITSRSLSLPSGINICGHYATMHPSKPYHVPASVVSNVQTTTPTYYVRGDVSHQGKMSAKFNKYPWGTFVVMEDFVACDENEISVSKGEHVSVRNRDDPDWFWIMRYTTGKEEGLIPSRCLHEVAATQTKHAAKYGHIGGQPTQQSCLPHPQNITQSHAHSATTHYKNRIPPYIYHHLQDRLGGVNRHMILEGTSV